MDKAVERGDVSKIKKKKARVSSWSGHEEGPGATVVGFGLTCLQPYRHQAPIHRKQPLTTLALSARTCASTALKFRFWRTWHAVPLVGVS